MDDLNTLGSLGPTLPTPAYLIGAILFGIIGIAAYRYGEKTSRSYPKRIGISMMPYPYVISQTWLLYAVGAGMSAALYVFRE